MHGESRDNMRKSALVVSMVGGFQVVCAPGHLGCVPPTSALFSCFLGRLGLQLPCARKTSPVGCYRTAI